MKSITLIFLTVILLGKLQASNTGSSATKNAAWKTLVGKDFTIQYPKDWILDQTGAMGTAFFLSAPKAKPDDDFRIIKILNHQVDGVCKYHQPGDSKF
jgi:hypothetical protein